MVRAWHGRDTASVNQTRSHCVNQMGKTHFKPLAARHGRGMSWVRHATRESALRGLKHFQIDMVWMTGLTSGASGDFPPNLGKVPTIPPLLQWVLGLNFGEHPTDHLLL
jgi:hypothetical protein